MLRTWPVKRMVVPHNIGFAIHRFNEFMMLMLGETLLQLVIAEVKEGSRLVYYLLTGGGFVICACMMYSFHITEPHHMEEHVLMRASQARPGSAARRYWTLAGILYMGILMSLKSVFVLLTGVGIKLAAYDPTSSPHAPHAFEQRLQLGTALLLCFGMNLIMRPLHSRLGILRYYSSMFHGRSHERLSIVACRLSLCAAHLGVAYAPLNPLASVLVQAAVSCAQVGLIIRERHAAYRDGARDSSASGPDHHHQGGRMSSVAGRMTFVGEHDTGMIAMYSDTFGQLPGLETEGVDDQPPLPPKPAPERALEPLEC